MIYLGKILEKISLINLFFLIITLFSVIFNGFNLFYIRYLEVFNEYNFKY